ncbi:MAG: hypothetical protein JNL58_15220 [Planctomyces sp.]|nr:hypothetical protein [Planctomyces sp.]
MNRPELRLDVLTGRQVIVAPGRSVRPNAHAEDPPITRTDDPFTEGCESETPSEYWALRREGSRANEPGWKVRVVPNRYPAVARDDQSEATPAEAADPLFPRQVFTGTHDVVIECSDNRTRLVDLRPAELLEVLRAWQIRLRELEREHRYRTVAVFRNEGFSAGASLSHCHSQILASERLVPGVAARERCAVDYAERTGRSLFRDWLSAERTAGERMISESDALTVLSPFASRAGWQVNFVPRTECPAFYSSASESLLNELASRLHGTVSALNRLAGSFSYNLLMVHPPLPNHQPESPPHYPWMLELIPRLGRAAGWELLTDVEIVTVPPEIAAAGIREELAIAGTDSGPLLHPQVSDETQYRWVPGLQRENRTG